MEIKGVARVDARTKDLAKRIQPGEIAIINHKDIDEVAADSLVAAKVKAVINAAESISGMYPNLGPITLAEKNIVIIDNVGKNIMSLIVEGEEIIITSEGEILKEQRVIGKGEVLTENTIKELMEETKKNLGLVLDKFLDNTITYAQQEKGLITGELQIPEVSTDFKGRHTLIVVRGQNYKEDLATIKTYIEEVHPILIGVDGGADALREFGYRPDLVIGDMDSISDDTLRSGAEIVVHAYPDGRAPGLQRVTDLGLSAKTFPAPGTSEDIAMLLAYEKGTDLIVAVGTHSNLIDFLEKGRKGMASTFLVRMKVGSILVDAKGVSRLYRQSIKPMYLILIILAALVPFFLVLIVTPATRQLLRLIYLQIKVFFGI